MKDLWKNKEIQMEVIRMKTKTDISATLSLPTEIKNSEIEVIIVIASQSSSKNIKLDDLIGKLEWEGDTMKVQRELRQEWE